MLAGGPCNIAALPSRRSFLPHFWYHNRALVLSSLAKMEKELPKYDGTLCTTPCFGRPKSLVESVIPKERAY